MHFLGYSMLTKSQFHCSITCRDILYFVLTSILTHPMTSSVPNLHNIKILNISGTSWDMTKRKTPFFFNFKGLSNSPIFQYLNFSFHRHFKVSSDRFRCDFVVFLNVTKIFSESVASRLPISPIYNFLQRVQVIQ